MTQWPSALILRRFITRVPWEIDHDIVHLQAMKIPTAHVQPNTVPITLVWHELAQWLLNYGFYPLVFQAEGLLPLLPSVRLSVCHTFFTMFPSSCHRKIFRSYYHRQKWCPCNRSRSEVKVTEVKTQLSRFRAVTRVWIDRWLWNDAQSLT